MKQNIKNNQARPLSTNDTEPTRCRSILCSSLRPLVRCAPLLFALVFSLVACQSKEASPSPPPPAAEVTATLPTTTRPEGVVVLTQTIQARIKGNANASTPMGVVVKQNMGFGATHTQRARWTLRDGDERGGRSLSRQEHETAYWSPIKNGEWSPHDLDRPLDKARGDGERWTQEGVALRGDDARVVEAEHAFLSALLTLRGLIPDQLSSIKTLSLRDPLLAKISRSASLPPGVTLSDFSLTFQKLEGADAIFEVMITVRAKLLGDAPISLTFEGPLYMDTQTGWVRMLDLKGFSGFNVALPEARINGFASATLRVENSW